MAYPWHIRTASPDEKDLRRAALDFFGLLATFASLVVVTTGICLGTCAYRYNFIRGREQQHRTGIYARIARVVYLADWWLQRRWEDAVAGGRGSLARRGAASSRWSARQTLATALARTRATLDYLHLTKRLSHTAASLLPAQYLLSARFLLQLGAPLTHHTHETLAPAHRFVGRTIYTLVTLHGGLYMVYFVRYNPARFFRSDVVLGITALCIITAIFVTSLPGYRRAAYRFFFGVHQLLAVLVLPALWLHVVYARRYVLLAGAIYLADRVGRYFATGEVKLRVTYASATALDLRAVAKKEGTAGAVPAGSHYYLYVPGMPGSRGNPFTLANASGGGSGELGFLLGGGETDGGGGVRA
ncbi:hypothetical protein DRE_07714 [Drechslerella stenobrocha 248]|uniref:Ferric oxidoreductase domain-containing protein n=1 Tax=Drechslerella stenobrocha 248 TaxID=1043628 RepID=W7HYF0_9PEZI|nr:hypothetical protein DRE_07714 [Drechslerella stenobrocha 248]